MITKMLFNVKKKKSHTRLICFDIIFTTCHRCRVSNSGTTQKQTSSGTIFMSTEKRKVQNNNKIQPKEEKESSPFCPVECCDSQARRLSLTVSGDQGTSHTYLLVGVGTPEDMWLTTVSFMLVRGRGGLKEKTFTLY